MQSLLSELVKLDTTNEYILFMPQGYEKAFDFKFVSGKVVLLACPQNTIVRRFYEQVILPFVILLRRPDIVFSTNNVCPVLLMHKNILLLYDMARWHVIEGGRVINFFQKTLIALSAKAAKTIVTISEFSKQEIVKYAHVNPEKIKITYAGVRFGDYQLPEDTSVIDKLGLDGEYCVTIGTIDKRKNHVSLIKAFEQANLPLKLVIIGKEGEAIDDVQNAIKSSSRSKDIILTGYISQEAANPIVAKALFYVTTTLYEGAGMATLELMGRGKAAIASDLQPIREYCGDAFLPVLPNDVTSIAHALKLLYTDSNLRKDLQAKGIVQAKKFSWEQNAQNLLEIFEK
jgi:glycosyltransferase involved in cell wall biosynthesis